MFIQEEMEIIMTEFKVGISKIFNLHYLKSEVLEKSSIRSRGNKLPHQF